MYVACPSCKALYAISADQLKLADGRVRCSQCRTTFNAAHAVFDDPRQALAFEYPLEEQLLKEIDDLVDRALDQVSTAAETPSPPGVAEDEAAQAARAPAAKVEPVGLRLDMDYYAQPAAAEFVATEDSHEHLYELSESLLFDDEPVHHRRTSWGPVAATLLLTLALAAQYGWWDRNRLAQVAALRPVLEWLCQPLGCDLPLRRDLARVEMVGREVRDHPQVADALLVSAAFVNRAPYPQAYPVLQISFSDVSGTPVAVRRFMPEEYLHDKNPARGMAPGEETLVMLEVVDPGERAVSFQFDFM
jgi:predicted Zn finger-like uncharacterized protein